MVECGNVRTEHHALTVQVARIDSSGESLLGDREQQLCELGAGDEHVAGGKGAGDEQGRQKRCAPIEGCQRVEILSAEDMRITCVCGSKARDSIMLKCTHCRLEEHGACYRVLEENETPLEHCCLRCALVVGDLVCTDPKLVKVYQKKGPEYVVHTCNCRRMLAVLLTEEFENSHQLLEKLCIEQDIGGDLLKKLSDEGVVSSADGAQFMIYQDQLLLSMAKLFGGKWKEQAAVIKSPREQGGDGARQVEAGQKGRLAQGDGGSKDFGHKGLLKIDQPETTKKSEKAVSSREMIPISGSVNGVKGRKMSQSGLLDVSVSTKQQGNRGKYPGECGGRKRKGPTISLKKAEVDVNVEVGDGQGKRQRRLTRGTK